MRFSILLISIFILGNAEAQIPSFLQRESFSEKWSEEKESSQNPGWWNQYYMMKKNTEGEIPRLPYAAIEAQQQQSVDRQSLLFNVQELGPDNIGGRTRAIMVDADNQDRIFAGEVSGGLWVSEDQGITWNPIDDYMQSLAITFIAQDAFNHDLIYAATGESSGNSAGIPGNGIFKSDDHGNSFYQLPATDTSAFDYVNKIVTSPVDSGWLYAATNNAGLFRSMDGGNTFQKVFSTTAPIRDMEIMPSGAVWIGVAYTGIFYSATGDSGTFAPMMNGLPAGSAFARIEMAYAPSDTLIMYASLEQSSNDGLEGIYRTTNGGQNWIETLNPEDDYNMYFSQTWYSMTMAVHPTNPQFVIIGVGDLAYTTDGGIVWIKAEPSHVDYHALTFDPFDPTQFYAGNDGGIYKYRVSEIHYNNDDLNNGYSTIQYYAGSYFPTGIRAYGGTQDNGTHHCENGNPIFWDIYGGDGGYNAVNQQIPQIAYVSTQNGMIRRTDNADQQVPNFYSVVNDLDADFDGAIDDGAWFINPFEINLYNGDQLFFATSEKVWITYDGGFGWLPFTNNLSGGSPYAIGVSHDANPMVYIGGENGIFYRQDDVMNSFAGDEVNLSTSVPAAVTLDFIHSITVHPSDKGICYVAFSSYSDFPRVWKVTNADTNSPQWESISGDLPVGLPVNYIDVDLSHPDSFFLAGTDFGLYVSNDAGQHWVKDPIIPNVVVYQVKVRPWDRAVFVFTHGRGMWLATLDTFNVGVNEISSPDLDVSVYPNPCSNILYGKTLMNDVDVALLDVNGKMVQSLKAENEFSLNMSSFPAGIYILQLANGTNSILKKIVKVE